MARWMPMTGSLGSVKSSSHSLRSSRPARNVATLHSCLAGRLRAATSSRRLVIGLLRLQSGDLAEDVCQRIGRFASGSRDDGAAQGHTSDDQQSLHVLEVVWGGDVERQQRSKPAFKGIPNEQLREVGHVSCPSNYNPTNPQRPRLESYKLRTAGKNARFTGPAGSDP